MQQIFLNLVHLLLGFWRFRWTALIVCWLVAIAGWTLVESLEYRYASSARVYISSNEVLDRLLRRLTVQPDITKRVSTVSRALVTTENLKKLVENADIKKELYADQSEVQVFSYLRDNLWVYPQRRDGSTYVIEFEHKNPELAQSVVESMLDIFIENSLGKEQETNNQTQKFLDSQIEDTAGKLRQKEQEISDFRRENTGALPSEAGGFYQRLQYTQSNLSDAKLELQEAINRRAELVRQLSTESPIIYETEESKRSAKELRIGDLQDELDALLVRYTDAHPRAKQLQETINDLQIEFQAESKLPNSGTRRGRAQDNVVYQSLKPIVAESEARVAELNARVKNYRDQVIELEETADSIPIIESQLIDLSRDYDTLYDKHQSLLERREAARLSFELEKANDESKFSIIEPPVVPMFPDSPNKKVLNLGVLASSIGAGVALAILFSMLRPVFYDQKTLSDLSGLPVYGSVSLQRSRFAKIARLLSHVIYFSLFFLLLLVAIGLVVMKMKGLEFADLEHIEALKPAVHLFQESTISSYIEKLKNSDLYNDVIQTIRGFL